MNTGDDGETEPRRDDGEVSHPGSGNKITGKPGDKRGFQDTPGAAGADRLAGELLAAEEAPSAGPGRPLGAKNKRQDHLREYAAQLGAEPGEVIIATALHGLREHLDAGEDLGTFLEERAKRMAKSLGMKKAAALSALRGLLGDAMPYVHQKLPLAVNVEGGGIMFVMTLPDGTVQTGAQAAAGGVDLRPANMRKAISKDDETGE